MFRAFPLVVAALAAASAAPAAAQSLRGSPSSIERMYRQAQRNDLDFIESGPAVRRAAREGRLVRLSGNDNYRVGNVTHPYVLPSTRTWVQRVASRYRAACGERLVVTSGVRPLTMRLVNSTDKSVHPTGMAVDLRKPRSGRCLTWLRSALSQMERDGIVEATEERRPPHFHVAVFSASLPGASGDEPRRLADARPSKRAGSKSKPSGSAGAKTARKAGAGKGVKHKVRRGESIWTIARRNGVTVERIKNVNNLSSSRIVAGQVLVIPRGR